MSQRASADRGPRRAELNERERKFVERFMATGNATTSAAAAGYSRKAAGQIGYRLLKKSQIQAAIAKRAQEDPRVWDREARQRFWTQVAAGDGRFARASLRDRLRASELLGRCQADFLDRHAGGRLSLEQALELAHT